MSTALLLPPLSVLDAERTHRAEAHLSSYVRAAWPVLEPATIFRPNWHMDLLCEYLEAVLLGQISRLVINVPPRSLKSTIVTIDWPTWAWLHRPTLRWMFASYSSDLSEDHSQKRRTLIQSEWYQSRWGDRYQLADDRNQVGEFKNTHQGTMIATSMRGTATGKGGDVVVIDDPHNPKEAESDIERTTAIRNFDLTFSTRLDDPKTGAIVLVMQRLHEQDLTAHCLAKGYTHVSLPMRAEGSERHVFPLSGRVVERAPDELLHPDRWGPAEVATLEKDLGPYGAAGQLQQRPAPLEGGLFKRAWWAFWWPPGAPEPPPVEVRQLDGTIVRCKQAPLPAKQDPETRQWHHTLTTLIQSWDMAFKDEKSSDYVCGQVWGTLLADRFLLDQVYDHLDFNASCAALIDFSAKWPDARWKLIEDKANGPAVMAAVRRILSGIKAVEPRGSKYARAQATIPEIASGNTWLPHPHYFPWVKIFITNHANFPNAAHDDDVDAGTQARDFLGGHGPVHDYGQESLY